MDRLVERFLTKIEVKDMKPFENSFFTKMENLKEINKIVATLSVEKYLPITSYIDFFRGTAEIEKRGIFISDITFKYRSEDDILDLVDDYLDYYEVFDIDDVKVDENNLYLCYHDLSFDTLLKDTVARLKKFLKEINSKYIPSLAYNPEFISEEKEKNIDDDFDDFDFYAQKEADYRKEAEYSKNLQIQAKKEWEQKQKDMQMFYPMKLVDVKEGMRVIVEGKIFKREDKKTKKDKLLATFWFTDGSSSINFKMFEGKRWDLETINSFTVGKNCKIKGLVEFDSFSNQIEINVNKIELLPDDEARTDEATEKRVELHLHTKMSAMDAVSTITDYIDVAKAMGHKAIAITDHAVVQSFPEAQDMGKRKDIKIIYGAELYMVETQLDNVFNPCETPLNDGKYVVFDLETTGLSARYDRIIEFGAVKVENGVVIDEVDFFINPDIELKAVTTNLTGITNEMVRGGKSISKALDDIVEFIGDAILVSHNATFDVGFLNEALKNNNRKQLDNPVVDTLPLSRYIFSKQKSHTLGAVCRSFDVSYDESSAHRAIYDAQVLSNVWQCMISTLSKNNPNIRHCDLEGLTCPDIPFITRPNHVTVYCKNQQGLKDLFQIISASNIDYLGDVPRVPRFLLEKFRENLIIGSGCVNGEVFQANLTRSEEVVMEKMKFYDFIEVQPPANYSFLVPDGQVSSEEDIKKVIRDLIATAKKLGKIVCATGDVHYANPSDKIFRDVYIFAKGLKGARHPLNPYRRDRGAEYENPDQHYRSTVEMKECFSFLNDSELVDEIVVKNTNLIADMCDEIKPIKDKLYPPKIDHCAELLEKMVFDKAHDWYGDPLPQVISDRLEAELKGIRENDYYVIYYIASKLVSMANQAGYIVGSRGSVGSSFVATMASITEVNPLPPHYRCPKCKHLEFVDPNECHSGFDLPEKDCPECGHRMIHDGQNIPFATFLGFKADKVPDIDLNFPSDYQAKAHELTKDLLGKDNVFKAGTIETVAEKTAIGYVKGYFEAKHIDPDSIRKAEIERLAIGCQNVKRTTGQHPGGIIVIPNNMSVYDFTPIQYPANETEASWKTTHFDFHAIHDNVLKLDLLGHVDPYALRMMTDITGIDVHDIPLNDPQVLSLFSSNKALNLKENVLGQSTGALGLPEFGTNFVRKILEETRPKTFADLLIISGLSHGTDVYNGNAQDLINSGVATLRDVIGCRDDIMTGLADRYGINPSDSFKIMELVRKNNFTKPKFAADREKYEAIMREHNVPEYYIESCCKIKYLFPKAHAVAYCMMGVRVGWFKVYKPLAYYATYFTARCNAYDLDTMVKGKKAVAARLKSIADRRAARMKIENKENDIEATLTIAMEMLDRGYKFLPISITRSDAIRFTIDEEQQALIPPFSAIDGLGESVATSIVEARKEHPFTSEEDLSKRTRLSSQKISELREMNALDGLHASEQMTLDDLFNM